MNILELFKPIKTFVFDVDGVLATDMLLIVQGDWARSMNIKDGFGLQLAVKMEYRVVIVSGGKSVPVQDRLSGLGIKDIFLAQHDKLQCYKDYINEHELNEEEIMFMGDDLPDLPAMSLVGLPVCPADAVTEVKEFVQYISPLNGGQACVREVIEKVLKLNDHWNYRADVTSR